MLLLVLLWLFGAVSVPAFVSLSVVDITAAVSAPPWAAAAVVVAFSVTATVCTVVVDLDVVAIVAGRVGG